MCGKPRQLGSNMKGKQITALIAYTSATWGKTCQLPADIWLVDWKGGWQTFLRLILIDMTWQAAMAALTAPLNF